MSVGTGLKPKRSAYLKMGYHEQPSIPICHEPRSKNIKKKIKDGEMRRKKSKYSPPKFPVLFVASFVTLATKMYGFGKLKGETEGYNSLQIVLITALVLLGLYLLMKVFAPIIIAWIMSWLSFPHGDIGTTEVTSSLFTSGFANMFASTNLFASPFWYTLKISIGWHAGDRDMDMRNDGRQSAAERDQEPDEMKHDVQDLPMDHVSCLCPVQSSLNEDWSEIANGITNGYLKTEMERAEDQSGLFNAVQMDHVSCLLDVESSVNEDEDWSEITYGYLKTEMERDGDQSGLFNSVQVEDSEENSCLHVQPVERQRFIELLVADLEAQDGKKLKLDLDWAKLPQSLDRHFLNDLLLSITTHRLADEEISQTCPAIEETVMEDRNICLVGDEPTLKYKSAFERMECFTTPPLYRSSCFSVEEGYGEHQKEELNTLIFKLSNGTCVAFKTDIHINLSVKTSAVTTPSGQDENRNSGSYSKPQSGSTQSPTRHGSTTCYGSTVGRGGGGASGGGSGGDGGGGGDDRRGGRDYNQPLGSCKKKKLKELWKRAQQLLQAFCCQYCGMSPNDFGKLCLHLRLRETMSGSEVVCSLNDCPGEDFRFRLVVALRLGDIIQPLLHLRDLFLTKSTDTTALSEAIQNVQELFLCGICIGKYIFTENPVSMCEQGHWMCASCSDNTEGACPYCRGLMEDGFSFNWPGCLFSALNEENADRTVRSQQCTLDNLFQHARGGPTDNYIPPDHRYQFGIDKAEQAELDSHESQPRNTGNRLKHKRYSAFDLRVLQEGDESDSQEDLKGFQGGPPTEPHDTPPPAEFQFPSSQSMDQEPPDDGVGDFLFVQRKFNHQQLNIHGDDFEDYEEEQTIEVDGVYGAVGGDPRARENTCADRNMGAILQYLQDDVCLRMPSSEVQVLPPIETEIPSQQVPSINVRTEDSAGGDATVEEGNNAEQEDETHEDETHEDEDQLHVPGMEVAATGETVQAQYYRNYVNQNAKEDDELETDSALDAASQGQVTRRKQAYVTLR